MLSKDMESQGPRLRRAASHSFLETKSSRFERVMDYIRSLAGSSRTVLESPEESWAHLGEHLGEHELEGLTWALIFELQREQKLRREAEKKLDEERRLARASQARSAAALRKAKSRPRSQKSSRRVRFFDEPFRSTFTESGDDDCEGGLDDDFSDDGDNKKFCSSKKKKKKNDESSDDDDDDSYDSSATVEDYESAQEIVNLRAAASTPDRFVSECVVSTLERHASGLQAKNDALQTEICRLEERIDREVNARLAAEKTCIDSEQSWKRQLDHYQATWTSQLAEDTKRMPGEDSPLKPTPRHQRQKPEDCPVCYEQLSVAGDRSPRRMNCCNAIACYGCLVELADEDGTLCCPECFETLKVQDAYDDNQHTTRRALRFDKLEQLLDDDAETTTKNSLLKKGKYLLSDDDDDDETQQNHP